MVWVRQILAFLFLLGGGFILIQGVWASLRWVFQVTQLAAAPDLSLKYGLRTGSGVFLLVLAFVLWNPEFWRVLPCGLLAALIIGGGTALNMHIRQKYARRMVIPTGDKTQSK